jgi:hypothetical protein
MLRGTGRSPIDTRPGRRTIRAAPTRRSVLSGSPLMPAGAPILVPRVRLLLSAGCAKMIPAVRRLRALHAVPWRAGTATTGDAAADTLRLLALEGVQHEGYRIVAKAVHVPHASLC